MISVNENTYKNLARELVSKIGGSHYFNGRIELEEEGMSSVLKTTLIVFRDPLSDDTCAPGNVNRITDIIPVWWEFEAVTEEGLIISDFSWMEFRPYLLLAV